MLTLPVNERWRIEVDGHLQIDPEMAHQTWNFFLRQRKKSSRDRGCQRCVQPDSNLRERVA